MCRMSFESDELNALEQKKLATDDLFVLPAAQDESKTLDLRVRRLAKKIDDEQSIHYWYALFDAFSSACSMYRYGGDLAHNTPDEMHDSLMTPTGILIAAVETLFLSTFATLAVKFDKEKKCKFKKWLAKAWPYLRDLIKALKNAYKGWRSTVVALNFLLGVNLNYLVTPIGLILGLLAATHRLWLRKMVEARKKMMVFNLELKKTIMDSPFSEEKAAYYLSQIKFQTVNKRFLAYLSAGSNGLIDGLYLYMGALALASLSAPIFGTLFVICVIYTIACVVNRIFEEYEFQTRLMLTQTKCILAILVQQIKATHAQIAALQGLENPSPEEAATLRRLKGRLLHLLRQLDEKRELQKKQSSRTTLTSILFGLKNALYAYNALSAILFFSAALFLLLGVACAAPLFITFMVLGVLSTLFFIIHSISIHHLHRKKQAQPQQARPYDELVTLRRGLEDDLDRAPLLDEETLHRSLEDAVAEQLLVQYFFQEWFEVIRSWFSGFGKGQKMVSFTGNAFQVPDADGHYQDTFLLRILGLVAGGVVSTVFGLRNYARGLGRQPLGQEPATSQGPVQGPQADAKELNDSKEAADSLDLEENPEYIPLKQPPKPEPTNRYGRFFPEIQAKEPVTMAQEQTMILAF